MLHVTTSKLNVIHLSTCSVKLIKEWEMHIIRTVNQDRARTNILENMKSDEALLERDWGMKFLPLQYRYFL